MSKKLLGCFFTLLFFANLFSGDGVLWNTFFEKLEKKVPVEWFSSESLENKVKLQRVIREVLNSEEEDNEHKKVLRELSGPGEHNFHIKVGGKKFQNNLINVAQSRYKDEHDVNKKKRNYFICRLVVSLIEVMASPERIQFKKKLFSKDGELVFGLGFDKTVHVSALFREVTSGEFVYNEVTRYAQMILEAYTSDTLRRLKSRALRDEVKTFIIAMMNHRRRRGYRDVGNYLKEVYVKQDTIKKSVASDFPKDADLNEQLQYARQAYISNFLYYLITCRNINLKFWNTKLPDNVVDTLSSDDVRFLGVVRHFFQDIADEISAEDDIYGDKIVLPPHPEKLSLDGYDPSVYEDTDETQQSVVQNKMLIGGIATIGALGVLAYFYKKFFRSKQRQTD